MSESDKKEGDKYAAEYEKEKSKDKKQIPKQIEEKPIELNDRFLEDIQSKLRKTNIDELREISKASTKAAEKVLAVKDFEGYFRPYQEGKTLLWNELGKVNSYDLPINVNAGDVEKPASYSKTITLYFNSASNEQMETIEKLRGKSQDLDRIERLSNMPITELEKKGLKIPSNYFTISTEAAQAKETLLITRIVALCGIDKTTAESIKKIADSRSLLDILDSWEYRCRTGYPNSKTEPGGSTSVSGYQ